MSVSPVSSPPVVSQPTTAPAPKPTHTASSAASNRPPQSSSPAPGTGQKVDKHV